MNATTRRLLTKQDFSPEEERVFREFMRQWEDEVEPLADDIAAAVRRGDVDLSSKGSIRSFVESRTGRLTSDIEVLFREQGEDAAIAGRTLAARRQQLDISFDVINERAREAIEEWAVTASESVPDTIAEEATNYLRGAREEGLDIETIADEFRDEYVDGRLTDTHAEQIARDNVQGPSNIGAHSAHEDADGVVGERWFTNIDGRERDSHAAADGQVVAVGGTFDVGGYEAQHPHDPALPVEESTNCRCGIRGVFADELTASQLEAIEAGERIYV